MDWMRRHCRVNAVCLSLGLAGCVAYHAAPLTLSAPLKSSLAALNTRQPDGREISTSPPLTLRNVAALAVLNDPDLIAARAQHGTGEADLLSAGLLPDPTVSIGFAALISGPGSIPAISGSLAQDISALITYRIGLAAAKAGLAQVDAGILWQEWQVAGQAQALCIAIAADEQTLATLRADGAALAQVNQATQRQVAASNLTLAAGSASMAALAATQTALNTAIQTRDQDRGQLDALLGLQPGIDIPAVPPAAAPIPPQLAQAAIATLARRRPDLIALRYGYVQEDARLRAAILTQFLPITIGGSGGRDTSNVWSAGPQLTLNLPLFNRNRGGIAGATATRAQLAAQFTASLAGAEGAAEALLARISVLRDESHAADTAARAAASTASQSQAAFANGSLDALSAVNLQTAAGDRQREAIALHEQLLTAMLSLTITLGIGLPPIAQPASESSP
jgi:outer membrane protein TolC